MNSLRGFTLVEVIVTILLLAILGAVAGYFIRPAIEAFVAIQRRAELSDAADTALRRLARDVRLALPNSVRTTGCGAGTCLELLLTRTGGRYRVANDDDIPAATSENALDFAATDTQFDTIGPLSTLAGQTIVTGSDRVAVHNLGITGADAYNGDNTSLITGFVSPSGSGIAGEDRLTITAKRFPLESPSNRFYVIAGPVSFECLPGALDSGGNGTGTLRRWSGYAIQPGQPTAAPGGSVNVLLANFVTACELDYAVLALQGRGLVGMRIELTRGGERVTLYHEVHVSNVP